MRRYGHLLLAGLFFLWSCNGSHPAKDTKKDATLPPKDNYIILLDLSDRILFNNQQQVPKDIDVIKSIYGVFKAKLDSKDSTRQYYTINDKIKLLAAPHWFYASVDLSAEQPDKRASVPDKTEKTLNILLPEIYKDAVTGNSGTAYSGTDIWKYFNEYLTDDLEKDGQNTLFIVTDGYMNLKKTGERPAQKNRYTSCSQVINALKNYPDWETRFTEGDYGLLPISKKMTNLRVVLLQVNPKEGWSDEYSLLTKIWGKWLTEMGISDYHFIKDDSTNEVKESLAKLMNVKINATALPEQWTTITLKDSSRTEPTAATKEPVMVKPVAAKEKTTIISTAPVANASPEKKTPVVSKKSAASTPEVIPPDESDTRLLTTPKANKPPAKKTVAKDDGDILQDAGAANGFNTGIKKDNKKKDP